MTSSPPESPLHVGVPVTWSADDFEPEIMEEVLVEIIDFHNAITTLELGGWIFKYSYLCAIGLPSPTCRYLVGLTSLVVIIKSGAATFCDST